MKPHDGTVDSFADDCRVGEDEEEDRDPDGSHPKMTWPEMSSCAFTPARCSVGWQGSDGACRYRQCPSRPASGASSPVSGPLEQENAMPDHPPSDVPLRGVLDRDSVKFLTCSWNRLTFLPWEQCNGGRSGCMRRNGLPVLPTSAHEIETPPRHPSIPGGRAQCVSRK